MTHNTQKSHPTHNRREHTAQGMLEGGLKERPLKLPTSLALAALNQSHFAPHLVALFHPLVDLYFLVPSTG